MSPRPRTRFAPSPTGYLHLGHVVNAIYVWGIARALGGQVMLRIEDHDRIRCRPEFETALLEDLDWLGFVPDEGRHPIHRQSDHTSAYEEALQRLRSRDRPPGDGPPKGGPHRETPVFVLGGQHEQRHRSPEGGPHGEAPAFALSDRHEQRHRPPEGGPRRDAQTNFTAHVYACDCSRKEIGGERYPGTCRTRGLEPGPGRGLRVVLDEGPETFDDLRLGPIVQTPAEQCGDLLIKDRDGHWTYQFAVTVDDHLHGIDLVIRGADLIASTGRQIALARLLGRSVPPRFLHHPLILKQGGEKLSKAAGDSGVRDLRRAGLTSDDIIGRAAAACGLLDTPRPIPAAEVSSLFGG